jgi:hypothetical protein
MSNLAELYQPSIRFTDLKAGMKLQVTFVYLYAQIHGYCVGDIVTVLSNYDCDQEEPCIDCKTNCRVIEVRTEGKDTISSCYVRLSYNGKPVVI